MDPKDHGIEVMILHNGMIMNWAQYNHFDSLDSFMAAIRRLVEKELETGPDSGAKN